jgi:general secretion pathway protein G
MERITVTGEFRTEGPTQKTDGRKQMLRGYNFSSFHLVAEKGFTLLELMIVISIIIILAAITLPQYQKTIKQTREAVLRDDLYKVRQLIDQYGADKGRLPQTLDDLVSEGYLREIPIDPFTGQRDWRPVTGDEPNSSEGTQGLIDIHSNSEETSSDGTPYSEW